MNLPQILLASVAMTLIATPAQAAEGDAKKRDAAIECGAFFTLMAEQTDNGEDAAIFTDMSNLLFGEAEGRLERLGVSGEEQERIGGEAVKRVNEQMTSGDIGITFSDCHGAMEVAIEALMPDVLTADARELLICGSQFVYSLQSGEFDEATNADFQTASDDQLGRAQTAMEKAGVNSEEQDQLSTLYGLSVGMVLGMGEEPLISWERCGEV